MKLKYIGDSFKEGLTDGKLHNKLQSKFSLLS